MTTVKRNIFEREILIPLTDADRLKLGEQIAGLVVKKLQVEAEKSGVVKDYSEEIKTIEKKFEELSKEYTQGAREEKRKVYLKYNCPCAGKKTFFSAETDEALQVEVMTDDDGRSLFLDDGEDE